MTYGVTPQGFARKALPDLLAEIEAKARDVFGPTVIQTPESPLGQLNGLFADLSARLWEIAEDVYQSYDPDQAEGARLDTLAKLRLLERGAGEGDAAFRQAITNAGRARIDLADIVRALRGVPGVTYAQVFVNETATTDTNGLGPRTIAAAVIGGADTSVAATLREYVVPGIDTAGNVMIDTVIDGYCRSIRLVRPFEVPVTISVDVRVSNDRSGCPPPSPSSIAVGLARALSGDTRPINGADITTFLVRQAIESHYPNVEVVAVSAARGLNPTTIPPAPLAIGFDEIAEIAAARIAVSVVP